MDQGEGVFINWTSSHASIHLLISKALSLSHLHTQVVSLFLCKSHALRIFEWDRMEGWKTRQFLRTKQ